MVGVAVVAMFTVFAASIKESIKTLADGSVYADLVVESDSFSGVGLDPAMAGEMAALPELESVVGAGEGVAMLGDGETFYPMILDVPSMPTVADMEVTQGSLEAVSDNGLAVSESYAEDKGWQLGTEVPVTFADGETVDLHGRRAVRPRQPVRRGADEPVGVCTACDADDRCRRAGNVG